METLGWTLQKVKLLLLLLPLLPLLVAAEGVAGVVRKHAQVLLSNGATAYTILGC